MLFKDLPKLTQSNHCYYYLIIMVLLGLVGCTDRDDTDPIDGGERSNLKIRVDYRTHCQYLVSDHGGITPRMNKDGTQICD